jgi:predicted Zn-dependent peptidase
MSSTFSYHELPNGLRVVCETMANVQSAAVGFLVRTGSRHESPPLHGVSHFLEHMCFKGTAGGRDWHAINVRFDELGSIYNAFTSKDHTFYYGWVPAGRVAEQIELLADMMRPALPAEEFETERGVILEEIAMSDDSFERHVGEFVHHQTFDGHPLAHEILGEKQTIAGLPRARLVEYLRTHYTADNMILIAAGAIEPEEIFATAGRLCGSWERSTNGLAKVGPPPPPAVGRRTLPVPQFKQYAVVVVYPSLPAGHADEEAIETFTHLFGGPNSRCYWNIVQKGICSHAGASWLPYSDCGVMALYAYGEPERAVEMLAALREQATEATAEGFSDDEVQRVKNQRRTSLALEGETPKSRLSQIMDDLETVGYVRTVGARLAAAEAVTVRGISDYLRRHPITGDGLLLEIGPEV